MPDTKQLLNIASQFGVQLGTDDTPVAPTGAPPDVPAASTVDNDRFNQLRIQFGMDIKEPAAIDFDDVPVSANDFKLNIPGINRPDARPVETVNGQWTNAEIEENPMGFVETMKDEWTTGKVLEKFPIVGGIIAADKQLAVYGAVTRLEADEYSTKWANYTKPRRVTTRSSGGLAGAPQSYITDVITKEEDLKRVTKYWEEIDEASRGKTFWGGVAQGVSILPTWMAEFALTGGLKTLGSKAAKKAAAKFLNKYVETKIGMATMRAAGWTGGALFRATGGMSPRIAENVAKRRVDVAIGKHDENWATSVVKGWGEQVIRAASEEAGGAITQGLGLPGKGIVKLMGKSKLGQKLLPKLRDRWIKITGKTEKNFYQKLLTKAGYSSIVGEVGEEGLEPILMAITDIDDFGAGEDADVFERVAAGVKQFKEGLLVTGTVLSIPGVTRSAVNQVSRARRRNKLVRAIVDNEMEQHLRSLGVQSPFDVETGESKVKFKKPSTIQDYITEETRKLTIESNRDPESDDFEESLDMLRSNPFDYVEDKIEAIFYLLDDDPALEAQYGDELEYLMNVAKSAPDKMAFIERGQKEEEALIAGKKVKGADKLEETGEAASEKELEGLGINLGLPETAVEEVPDGVEPIEPGIDDVSSIPSADLAQEGAPETILAPEAPEGTVPGTPAVEPVEGGLSASDVGYDKMTDEEWWRKTKKQFRVAFEKENLDADITDEQLDQVQSSLIADVVEDGKAVPKIIQKRFPELFEEKVKPSTQLAEGEIEAQLQGRETQDVVDRGLQEAQDVVEPTGEGERFAPKAEFIGFQEDPDGKQIALFNLTEDIPGHPKGSTVTEVELEKAGIDVPEIPKTPDVVESPKPAVKEPVQKVVKVPVVEKKTIGTSNTKKETDDAVKELAEQEPTEGAKTSTLSARQADIEENRESLGLSGMASKEKKTQKESLQNAKDKKIPEKAMKIASEVVQAPRGLSDEETAGLVIKGLQMTNEYSALKEEISKETDEAIIITKLAETQRLEAGFEVLFRAIEVSGSEKGRALAAQKLTIDKDYNLLSVKIRAKVAKGEGLTKRQDKRFEELTGKIENVDKKINKLEKTVKKISSQRTVRTGSANVNKNMSIAQKDTQLADLIAKTKKLLEDGC